MQLTIFYDGLCPLCAKEMTALKRRDKDDQIHLVDINGESFAKDYPELDWQQLNARLHAMLPGGQVITGLDVTAKAWSLVGMGWLYAPTRWPLLKPIFDAFYTLFARHRYRISYWLTGQRRCQTCQIKQ